MSNQFCLPSLSLVARKESSCYMRATNYPRLFDEKRRDIVFGFVRPAVRPSPFSYMYLVCATPHTFYSSSAWFEDMHVFWL